MDCRFCQPLLSEYALGQLTADEQDAVAQHLASGCSECLHVLRETETAWGLLADALPPVEVPPHIQAVLRSRIARERELAAAERSEGPRRRAAFTPEQDEVAPDRGPASRVWLAVAAGILVALTIGLVSWMNYSRSQWESQNRELAQRAREMQRLQSELDRANDLFNAGRLHFASLREAGPQSAIRGYVVWDRLTRQVHFYVFGLPPAAEGRVWRIWIAGADHDPATGGTLTPQPNGTASAIVDVPAELGERFRLSVVDGSIEPPAAPATEPWLTAEVE